MPKRWHLQRTEIRSPVNGYLTNLLVQLGDYATVGKNMISLVDADSFWVDGYFEETNLAAILKGNPAAIKLMGYPQTVRGHVNSHHRRQRAAGSGGAGLGQPDLHLGAPRSACPRTHPYR
jgi:multidrug resistance efflux pump